VDPLINRCDGLASRTKVSKAVAGLRADDTPTLAGSGTGMAQDLIMADLAPA
jgi:hypothetical protein